ncbi:hypothetical protein MPDQ_004432 [Monascus purpureus]|uniref:Uncharacterized protein n=1 Tax=Monascus purpureus TaxID=5098 RepID=A0A507QL24_MONPU|nr:hypothetical protein MPDQ_004432 [Monascus purpureus]BDD63011.1 hypothetical protein MAP00_007962 [Monascus purpureus]
MTAAWKAAGLTYNRYLAVAAGAVRRSLKEGARLHAEARGRTDLRFAKWKNGNQGELQEAAAAAKQVQASESK